MMSLSGNPLVQAIQLENEQIQLTFPYLYMIALYRGVLAITILHLEGNGPLEPKTGNFLHPLSVKLKLVAIL